MNRINWGIIGCGDVTEIKSGPAFGKVPQSALVAVMRRDAAKAEDYARRHRVARWYNDAYKLIQDQDVNAIYVATPPDSHEEYATAAMRAGKPVYLEKPMSIDVASASRIANIAHEKNLKLVVAHYRRAQPRFKTIRQLILDGMIGKVLVAKLELSKPPYTKAELEDPRNAWRVNPAIAGGGLFHDLAPHQLDLMYYFFGPVQKVQGIATRQGGQYDADDMVVANILFQNGVACCGSWCFNAPCTSLTDQCEILGTNGTISFNVFSSNSFRLLTKENERTFSFDELQHVQQPMIEATVRYFLGEGPNPCTPDEGCEIMRLMAAIVEA